MRSGDVEQPVRLSARDGVFQRNAPANRLAIAQAEEQDLITKSLWARLFFTPARALPGAQQWQRVVVVVVVDFRCRRHQLQGPVRPRRDSAAGPVLSIGSSVSISSPWMALRSLNLRAATSTPGLQRADALCCRTPARDPRFLPMSEK